VPLVLVLVLLLLAPPREPTCIRFHADMVSAHSRCGGPAAACGQAEEDQDGQEEDQEKGVEDRGGTSWRRSRRQRRLFTGVESREAGLPRDATVTMHRSAEVCAHTRRSFG
jgi:hypothetical protein